jgi:hypothetical protein
LQETRDVARTPSEQKPDRNAPTASMTPAQKAGKGRYFTGYWQGIYYIAGYPAPLVNGMIGSNTGAKKPTQTGGGKKKAR